MAAQTDATPVAVLGAEVSIVQAADNHERLLQALPALIDDPRLDMSQVTEFDSSGIQLLLALRANLSSQGKSLTLFQPSPVVREALAVFGLQDALPTAATPTH
jgi:anti-anti-sigma factor